MMSRMLVAEEMLFAMGLLQRAVLPADQQLDATPRTTTTTKTLTKDYIFCEQNVDNINIADCIELSAESFEFIETVNTDVSCLEIDNIVESFADISDENEQIVDSLIICCAPVSTPERTMSKNLNLTEAIGESAPAPKREVVSYQRYGRQNSKQLLQNKFKCHLCGFGCGIKETLLAHFRREHPT
ncbi:PREDICTED: uncharacterized protein LOC108971184 [Bactrocera latifrons]|uniref:uncharacterized protein LOC108971184 n=1 Tax=Bactrocera latifrons TaxID=174628 RepID=UPI0008DE5A55|nr:PREDICTED: uncharacterized protein LOC108971184 [Bactrocera latifrons]